MYFPDLTPYSYLLPDGKHIDNVLNIGWLDCNRLYSKGIVSGDITEKLRDILQRNLDVNPMRGIHECVICGSRITGHFLSGNRQLGMSEIWILGKGDIIYASPSLIFHYIRDHQYRPPDVYLEAVGHLDISGDWNPLDVVRKVLDT